MVGATWREKVDPNGKGFLDANPTRSDLSNKRRQKKRAAKGRESDDKWRRVKKKPGNWKSWKSLHKVRIVGKTSRETDRDSHRFEKEFQTFRQNFRNFLASQPESARGLLRRHGLCQPCAEGLLCVSDVPT